MRGGGCSFWTSQSAATRLLSRRNSTAWLCSSRGVAVGGNMAWGEQQGTRICSSHTAARRSDRRNLHFSLGGRGAIQMLLTNLLPFGRNHHNSSAVEPLPLNLAQLSTCRLRSRVRIPTNLCQSYSQVAQVTGSNPGINLCQTRARTLPSLGDSGN